MPGYIVKNNFSRAIPNASCSTGKEYHAVLTDQQREVLISWAKHQMTMLKNEYPADSLKMKRRVTPKCRVE